MRYDFRCDSEHVSEVTCSMSEVPSTVDCATCGGPAERVFTVPIVHFKGPGFYSTDVKGTLNRKRRKSAGDDLPKEFDRGAARVADAI